MKTIRRFISIAVLLLASLTCLAQVPKHDLGKSLSEMRQKYPNLTYHETRNKLVEYQTGNRTLTFKDNKLVCDCEDLFVGVNYVRQLLNKLEQTAYIRKSDATDNSFSFSQMFYYDGFWITVGYWYDDRYLNFIFQSPEFFKQ